MKLVATKKRIGVDLRPEGDFFMPTRTVRAAEELMDQIDAGAIDVEALKAFLRRKEREAREKR